MDSTTKHISSIWMLCFREELIMAQTTIRIRPKIPKNLSAFQKEKYAKRIFQAVADETRTFENMYNLVGKGFSERPKFIRRMNVSAGFLGIIGKGNLIGSTSTASKPFVYIDQGFQQTYQGVPTDDWRPRTTVRTLGIKGRRGGLKFVNKRKAGKKVQAREYSKEIAERRQKPFAAKIQKAMRPKGT